MKKRFISLILILCLTLCLPLSPARAAGDGPRKGDTVYLGEYQGQPLAWRVLDASAMNTGEPGLYLLSRYVLENGLVMYDGGVARWPGSKAQAWCGEFLESAFTPLEQAAIPAVSKTEAAFQGYGLSWGEVSLEQEKVFFLSTQEIADYIAANDGEAGISAVTPEGVEASWWLRTPHGFHTDYAGLVMGNDQVHDFLVYGSWGVRPAVNLSAETCLFLSPADTELAVGVPAPVPDSPDGSWKATLVDESMDFAVDEVSRSGDTLSLRYRGAADYVSALVRSGEGALLSYARLAAAGEASGTLSLELSTLGIPEGAALYLFTERENGPRRSNAASAPQLLSIPETAPETPAPEDAGSAEPAQQTEEAETAPAAAPSPAAPAGGERGFFGTLFLRYGLYLAAALGVLAVVMGAVQGVSRARRKRKKRR